MKTIVIGFGSDALHDDGLPVWLVEKLEASPEFEQVVFLTSLVGGLDLITMMDGAPCAVLIDTIKSAEGRPGDVLHFVFPAYTETFHLSSLHDVSFRHALELGKTLGFVLPSEIHIIAIEIADSTILMQDFSPPVKKRLALILEKVTGILRGVIQ